MVHTSTGCGGSVLNKSGRRSYYSSFKTVLYSSHEVKSLSQDFGVYDER